MGAKTVGATVSHGWKPETGFLRYRWQGYNEALSSIRAGPWLADARLAQEKLLAWTST